MIRVRVANESDVVAVRDIFRACYGGAYTDLRYFDEEALNKLIYSDDTLLLVAEDEDSQQILGTATVLLEVGAYSDLVGEFGRLAVQPHAQRRGIGSLLMRERMRHVQDRLQVGLAETRASHSYSARIAEKHGFAVVGYLPLQMALQQRESLALHVCYFGDGLQLRKNHPRIVPEVYPIAHLAMENCGVTPDAIVDEESPAYPPGASFEVQDLTTNGYAALLRIERGRVHRREIFGPLRLHYGFFKLQSRRSRYLIAREDGRIAGAVGFTLAKLENAVRVFELISVHDEVIRFLLSDLERLCREEWGVKYLEVSVSAYAPQMQRTLVELGFLPVAYVPALVFHEVERLDVIKMVRLLTPLEIGKEDLTPRTRALAEVVVRQFASRSVLPRIAQVVQQLPLFAGLNPEQVNRLAGICRLRTFAPSDVIFQEGNRGQEMYLLLDGEALITLAGSPTPVGLVRVGECLGELSLLTAAPHSVTATAGTSVEAAVLEHGPLVELIRLRPDIGLHIYKNFAVGASEKLKRLDFSLINRS